MSAANMHDPCLNPCFGIDVADDGSVVVAERHSHDSEAAVRHAGGESGMCALREHIGRHGARPRVCILSSGAAALAVALGLAGLPGGEIMLVAPLAIQTAGRSGREPAPATPEGRARELARLAGHLY